MSDSEKKIKLIDLRVLELRNELEKRSLDVSGVKVVLLERLAQVLRISIFDGVLKITDTN